MKTFFTNNPELSWTILVVLGCALLVVLSRMLLNFLIKNSAKEASAMTA